MLVACRLGRQLICFLLDVATRDKLAYINEKIVKLDRQITYLEAVNASVATAEVPSEPADAELINPE